jgi:hypothetical protein
LVSVSGSIFKQGNGGEVLDIYSVKHKFSEIVLSLINLGGKFSKNSASTLFRIKKVNVLEEGGAVQVFLLFFKLSRLLSDTPCGPSSKKNTKRNFFKSHFKRCVFVQMHTEFCLVNEHRLKRRKRILHGQKKCFGFDMIQLFLLFFSFSFWKKKKKTEVC